MYGLILGDEEFKESEYPESEDYVDEESGEWIHCPECGSEDAGMMLWGEGVDLNIKCPDCDNSTGVR